MVEKFIIKGGKPLNGTVEMSGFKNAAGPVLAASILTEEKVLIENLPLVDDIKNLIEILKEMGAEVNYVSGKSVEIRAKNIDPQRINPDKIAKTRVSVLLIGSLLARFRKFKIAHPGGDRIGVRPISTHLLALKELGVDISNETSFYSFSTNELRGKKIILKDGLDLPSPKKMRS